MSKPPTNNQDIKKAVEYTENDINDIYIKFNNISDETKLLVIKIIDDRTIKYLIVENIEPSNEKYYPRVKEYDIPSYLTVYYYYYYELEIIASSNDEDIEKKLVKTIIIPYNISRKIYDENKIDNATKYENGFLINDYKNRHQNAIQKKIDYENRYAKYQSSNNPIRRPLEQIKQINILDILKYSDLNNYEKEQLKEIVRKIGFAGLLVGLFALMFHLENKMKMKGGDVKSNTENYIQELAKMFTPDQARELANKIKTLVDKKAVIEEINNLDGNVKNDIKRNIVKDEDFKEFKLGDDETVFGNLFGDEDKKEGGKRKRTNKKRKTNKRKNNKKKSNRRYTDKV